MESPDLVLIRKNPALFRCPACSKTFDIGSYECGNGPEKMERLAAGYKEHFNETHAKEDASQAAARIVRGATESEQFRRPTITASAGNGSARWVNGSTFCGSS